LLRNETLKEEEPLMKETKIDEDITTTNTSLSNKEERQRRMSLGVKRNSNSEEHSQNAKRFEEICFIFNALKKDFRYNNCTDETNFIFMIMMCIN
jgi:hypothetical protein